MPQQSARAYLTKKTPKLRYISALPIRQPNPDDRYRTPNNVFVPPAPDPAFKLQ